MQRYSHHYSITAADMNKDYRLTPSAVLLYYQDCWARFMSVHHLAAFDIVKQGMMWVITEFNVELTTADAFWSEELNVTVWNSELTPFRLYSEFVITTAENRTEVAKGYACWNLLNTVTKRLGRTDLLEGQPEIDSQLTIGEHKKSKIDEEGEIIQTVNHKVNHLDLDFNGHTNNRSYLSIAMLTAPDEFLLSHALRQMHIKWMHETFLGDTIRCELRRIDDSSTEFLHILYNGANQPVATITSQWQPISDRTEISEIVERK